MNLQQKYILKPHTVPGIFVFGDGYFRSIIFDSIVTSTLIYRYFYGHIEFLFFLYIRKASRKVFLFFPAALLVL